MSRVVVRRAIEISCYAENKILRFHRYVCCDGYVDHGDGICISESRVHDVMSYVKSTLLIHLYFTIVVDLCQDTAMFACISELCCRANTATPEK